MKVVIARALRGLMYPCVLFILLAAGSYQSAHSAESPPAVKIRLESTVDVAKEVKAIEKMKIDPSRVQQLVTDKSKQPPYVSGRFKTTLHVEEDADGLLLHIAFQNVSDQEQHLSFSSGQMFDIIVRNEQGDEVYRWSEDKAFIAVLIDKSLDKGEALQFTEAWNMKDREGNQLPKGRYTVTAQMMARLKTDQVNQRINPEELVDHQIWEIR